LLNAEDLIYNMYDYFNVDNNIDLASKISTTPQTISNWKSRNAVAAIKKKCKELKIYKDIFDDSATFIQTAVDGQQINQQTNSGTSYNNVHMSNEDIENLELLKALNAMALALNKKDQLKAELTKLISTLPKL